MKAKIPFKGNGQTFEWDELPHNANFNYERKETIQTMNAYVISKGKICNPVTLAFYMGKSATASMVYANIWIANKKGEHRSGSGSAGGYGYHKGSAATQEAINNAGVTLDSRIDGRGDSAVNSAIRAIVAACGYRGEVTVK